MVVYSLQYLQTLNPLPVGGILRTILTSFRSVLTRSSGDPCVAAVVVVWHRRLDGDTHHLCVRVPVHTAWQTGKALGNGRYPRVQDERRSLLRPVKSKCRGAHTLSSQRSLKVHDRRGLVRPRSPRLTSADSHIQISPPDLRFLVDAA